MAYSLINLELVKDSQENDILTGWIIADTAYKAFSVDIKGKVEYSQSINKDEFTSLSHFFGVMGKFDPYAVFIDKIEVPDLNFATLLPLL